MASQANTDNSTTGTSVPTKTIILISGYPAIGKDETIRYLTPKLPEGSIYYSMKKDVLEAMTSLGLTHTNKSRDPTYQRTRSDQRISHITEALNDTKSPSNVYISVETQLQGEGDEAMKPYWEASKDGLVTLIHCILTASPETNTARMTQRAASQTESDKLLLNDPQQLDLIRKKGDSFRFKHSDSPFTSTNPYLNEKVIDTDGLTAEQVAEKVKEFIDASRTGLTAESKDSRASDESKTTVGE